MPEKKQGLDPNKQSCSIEGILRCQFCTNWAETVGLSYIKQRSVETELAHLAQLFRERSSEDSPNFTRYRRYGKTTDVLAGDSNYMGHLSTEVWKTPPLLFRSSLKLYSSTKVSTLRSG